MLLCYLQVSEGRAEVGAEVPGGDGNQEVRPQTELPASAEEQRELCDSHRGCEGVKEEHWLPPGEAQQEIKFLSYRPEYSKYVECTDMIIKMISKLCLSHLFLWPEVRCPEIKYEDKCW